MGKVLHASYSGYFPFCLNEYDLDPPFSAYAPISLEAAMRIWWRIKRFKFYGNYIANIGGELQEQQWEFTAIRNATSEQEIVCYKFPPWKIENQTNTDELQINMGEVLFFRDNEEIKYTLIFGFGFFVTNPSVQEQGINYASPWETDSGGEYDFEGLTLYNTQLAGGATILGHEILEYWSYGGTWNTVTGEPL